MRVFVHLCFGSVLKVSTASDSTECIELGKVSVAVTTSPVRVTPDLKISGHLLTVVVLSKKIHVAGVSISLHSDAAIKVNLCSSYLKRWN